MENGKYTKLDLNPNATIFYPTLVRGTTVSECNDSINQELCSMNNSVDIIPNYPGSTENYENEIQSHISHPDVRNIHNCTLNKTSTICEPTYSSLNAFRCQNLNRIIVAHLNINSIRNKFDVLVDMISNNIDILLLSETKIDDSFPDAQFFIPGFHIPYRLDRSKTGGGVLLYVREDIPSKFLKNPTFANDIECVMTEVNFYNKKWLVIGTYNPSKSTIKHHLKILGKHLDYFLPSYDNIMIMGDFNSEPQEYDISEFCGIYGLKNLVRGPTCFKSAENPSCIDLILTNRYRSFQSTITYETGLSDFHNMTLTVLKTFFKKGSPKIISYRDYKRYSPQNFRLDLERNLPFETLFQISNDQFIEIVTGILEKHAPLKLKYVRINQSAFITKELRKEIMKRSRLRNRVIKHNSEFNIISYKRQRNLCTSLIRKAKKEFYSNLNPSNIVDNKRFWNSVKPLFSDKSITGQNLVIIDNNIISDKDSEVADILSNFFSDVVKNLDIDINYYDTNNNTDDIDPILKAINKYINHPSIVAITKARGNNGETFSFSNTTLEAVFNELLMLNTSTSCPKEDIPIKIIKENIDIFTHKIHNDFNYTVDYGTFPSNLKNADVTPAHKKGDRTDKSNYRPISILPNMSKIFERLLYYQMNTYVEKILSTYQCGFRKNYSSQHCLIVMLEKWKLCLDKQGSTGVLLTDLSKAFDCLDHDLIIAKLYAYGFDYKAVKLIYDYLSCRFQRVRINSSYSSWKEILKGVPQGSILGPMLFNIYLSDLFISLSETNICSYADDNSPYACKANTDDVITQLQEDSNKLLQWFSHNSLKANPDKFHLILNNSDENLSINVGQYVVQNSQNEKLLGVTIDNKLTFNDHVEGLCKKASKKLHALTRVSRYMNTAKKRVIMKSFITSQFGYCPLVWMLHSRTLNNRINRIHERALRVVYNDNVSSFEEMLQKDDSVTIHEKNIQTLSIELFKVLNGLAPAIMDELFLVKKYQIYNSKFPFKSRNVRTVAYGTETLSFLGPKIWSIIPTEIKECKSLNEFKSKIKKWKPHHCPCRMCKTYIGGVGFIDVAE